MPARTTDTGASTATVAPHARRRPIVRRVVRVLVIALTALHAVIHLMGVVEGFGLGDVPELGSLSPAAGALWASAGLLVGVAALALARRWQHWWVLAGGAAVVSQAAVLTAWHDARAGTAVNAVLVTAALYGWAAEGPRSMRAAYRRMVAEDLVHAARQVAPPAVTEADLAGLPPVVAEYVRRSGAVGRPRVPWIRVRIHGRIRSDPRSAWMPFEAEQLNTFGEHPTRTFLMDATKAGLPVDVLHRFDRRGATMGARLCSLLPLVDERGPDLDQAETVTVLDDAALLAPAALVDLPLEWNVLDERHVAVAWTIGACTATAVLVFDAQGDLVDLVSDDRRRAAGGADGLAPVRWSTPVGAHRSFDGRRLPGAGQGRWHPDDGAFTYLELTVDDIECGPRLPA